MPKETISDGEFSTQVVWRRGLYAQLGVVTREPIESIADVDGSYSLWSDLTVADIDRLTKVLRRVRRQLLLEPDTEADDAYEPVRDGKVPDHG